MKSSFQLMAAAAACSLLIACGSEKEPADAAIKSAEQSVGAIKPQAEKMMPEEFKALDDSLAAARASYDKGDYKAANATATDVGPRATALASKMKAKKEEMTKQWEELASSVPTMVAAIKDKVDTLAKAKKLPAGMDAAKLAQAKDGLATMTQTWTEATAAATSGNVTDALAKGKMVKEKATEEMAMLGMQAPAAAAPASGGAPAAPKAPAKK